MSAPATEAALARTIGLRSVRAYLRANGWNREESLGGDTADIYVWAEDEREAAIVPASERYGDYGTRIYRIAEQLGRVEGRRMLAVLTDLALAESDLVRVRLGNAGDDDAVSLADGAAALDEAKQLLLAAACSADRPQRMYRAGRNKRATDYLRRVRLGQTEPGGFVINIISPVPPFLHRTLFPEEPVEEPFERRVVRMLVWLRGALGAGPGGPAGDRHDQGVRGRTAAVRDGRLRLFRLRRDHSRPRRPAERVP